MSSLNTVKDCYICGAKVYSLYKEVNSIPILKCKRCKLKWVEDINKYTIVTFYDKSYFFNIDGSKTGYKNYLSGEKTHIENSRNIIKEVDKIKSLKKARILDIGCAFGFLLNEAKILKQCDVYGVEISNYACEYAKKQFGINIFNCELDACNFDSNFFDVVFLIGVIEHLSSPKACLKYILRLLKPDGIIVITTIDTKSLIPLYSIKPPEHLFYFNHNNIALLLNKSGYKILLRKPYFIKYHLHDLFYRFCEFSSLSVFDFLSRTIKTFFPSISIRIPTNEMIVFAKKDNIS